MSGLVGRKQSRRLVEKDSWEFNRSSVRLEGYFGVI